MKRILFISISQEGLGVYSKAKKIAEGFKSLGWKVHTHHILINKNKFYRVIQLAVFYARIIASLSKMEYDIIFVRHSYLLLPFFIICNLYGKKIHFEINTKEREEFLLRRQKVRAIINDLSFSFAAKAAIRVHAVTIELMNYYKSIRPGLSIIYNPNFVLDEFFDKESTIQSDKINILFLGNANQSWQGLDLFILKVIVNNTWFIKNCHLHIVGNASNRILSLIDRHCLKNFVTHHGYLSGREKHNILKVMHFGIGVFNLSARRIAQATPIKIGEYLYAGLPVIIGYEDPRLNKVKQVPMWFRLNLEDNSSNHDDINQFIQSAYAYPRLPLIVHQYARDYMLVNNYIQKIIE